MPIIEDFSRRKFRRIPFSANVTHARSSDLCSSRVTIQVRSTKFKRDCQRNAKVNRHPSFDRDMTRRVRVHDSFFYHLSRLLSSNRTPLLPHLTTDTAGRIENDVCNQKWIFTRFWIRIYKNSKARISLNTIYVALKKSRSRTHQLIRADSAILAVQAKIESKFEIATKSHYEYESPLELDGTVGSCVGD